MKLSDMGLIELQQRRHSVLESLVEANKAPNDEAARIAARGLEAELADVSAEIDKREGRQATEAEAARRQMDPAAEYESGVLLSPKQSVRSYLQDSKLIKQPDFEKLQLGALLQSMVTGPKNEMERRVLAEGSVQPAAFRFLISFWLGSSTNCARPWFAFVPAR